MARSTDTVHLKPVRALPWSLIGMPGRSGEDLLWLVIQAAGVGLFETISIDGERVSRQSSSRQQVGEKKVSVTSITDRFCVPANFEDLGCPQGEHYESPHAGIWPSESRK